MQLCRSYEAVTTGLSQLLVTPPLSRHRKLTLCWPTENETGHSENPPPSIEHMGMEPNVHIADTFGFPGNTVPDA